MRVKISVKQESEMIRQKMILKRNSHFAIYSLFFSSEFIAQSLYLLFIIIYCFSARDDTVKYQKMIRILIKCTM